MATPGRVLRESDEKRAYYRLLRYLLSEEVGTSYKPDEEQSLPPRIAGLMNALQSNESSERH